MGVVKIFKIVGIAVACLIVIAVALNFLLPNVYNSLVDFAEDTVYKASGAEMDWNGNGNAGSNDSSYTGDSGAELETGGNVDGFN